MEKDIRADDETAARKSRLKKLVYANLVGASLLSALGFSASAHGNASSHKREGQTLTWDLDDFQIEEKEQAGAAPTLPKHPGEAETGISR